MTVVIENRILGKLEYENKYVNITFNYLRINMECMNVSQQKGLFNVTAVKLKLWDLPKLAHSVSTVHLEYKVFRSKFR